MSLSLGSIFAAMSGFLFPARSSIPAIRAEGSNAANPQQWFLDWVRDGQATASAIAVSPESALRCATLFGGIKVVAEDCAKLPLILYRRKPDGGKERAVDHPLYNILARRPNPRLTSFEFREMQQIQVELRGNAYAYVERDFANRPVALWPWPAARVTVLEAPDGSLFYRYQPKRGDAVVEPSRNVIHERGMMLDDCVGLKPIDYAREPIGMALAAEKYGAMFFANDAQPRGLLYHPQKLKDTAVVNIEDSFNKDGSGKDRHKVKVLEEGMKYQQIGMTNEDAQYLLTRAFQREEILAYLRVPQHKVGILTRSTFSNIEQQALEYVTDSLLPRLRRREQKLEVCLLTEKEQDSYYIEHLVDGLLRGDIAARYAAYQIARQNGVLNADEIRGLENLDKRSDGHGADYLHPANMVVDGSDPAAAGNDPAPASPAT